MASINELHDRLSKAQDVLVDLRQMIDRLAGNQSSNDQRRNSTSSNNNNAFYKAADADPFFYLDKEATDELVSDITDTLRDAQDDFDLLREDALDLGVIVSETASLGDSDDADVSQHTAHTSRSLRPSSFGASLRSSSAHSGGSGGGMSSSLTEDDTLAASIRGSVEGVRLQRGLVRLGEGLADARRAFRGAQLAARRHREDAQREQHRQILASYIEEVDEEDDGDIDDNGVETSEEEHRARLFGRARPSPLASKHVSPTTSAAADVTAALRQTHARITGEVARSEFAAQTLAESSRALAELGDKYGSGGASSGGDINSSLKSARNMVRGLIAAHKSDTWYLQSAMYIVLATIAWLLFRRLLYGPLWLLVWWPIRTVFGTAAWVGRASSGGNRNAVSSVSIGESPLTSIVTSVVMATNSVSSEVHATEAAQASESLVEEVGRIIDESTASGTTATGEASSSATEDAEQPNPKKRMWEEPVEEAKHEEQLRKEKENQAKAEQEGKSKQPADGERKKDEL
ncbi:Protein transport protein sec20 [Sporothrix bragantina]|uniref:Protein transport protein sec20 n=1 Tax=Sporothrix bragantina TaxID=671064 RepID=A0ABP0C4F9_9PEZI